MTPGWSVKSGVQVTKPAHLHDLGDGVERAERVAGLGEQVERARPGRRVALDHGEVGAQPSGVAVGALPGQVAAGRPRRIQPR